MILYKSALLGCGPRGREHAQAYKYVKNGKLVAICDLNEQRLNALGNEFGIDRCYTDIHEMLDKERPDLLHIVTSATLSVSPLTLRVSLLTIASDYEVPVVIFEKPIATQGEDFRALQQLNANSRTRFVVNTQMHFHPRHLELKRNVAEGRIGEIRFIDISTRSTVLDQGSHVLEFAHSYDGWASPISIMGQVSGAKNIPTGLPNADQPSPDLVEAAIAFSNGVRAQLLCGAIAPKTHETDSQHMHKRISVYGTRGFLQWTRVNWELSTPEGGYESGTHSYAEEDVLGQAMLTDAAFDWVKDESKVHPTRLELSLIQFNIILGIYTSALNHTLVELPFDPPDGLIDSLKARLT